MDPLLKANRSTLVNLSLSFSFFKPLELGDASDLSSLSNLRSVIIEALATNPSPILVVITHIPTWPRLVWGSTPDSNKCCPALLLERLSSVMKRGDKATLDSHSVGTDQQVLKLFWEPN